MIIAVDDPPPPARARSAGGLPPITRAAPPRYRADLSAGGQGAHRCRPHRLDDREQALLAAPRRSTQQFDEVRPRAHAIGEAASQVSSIPHPPPTAVLAFQREFGRASAGRRARRPRHRHQPSSPTPRPSSSSAPARPRPRSAPAAAPLELQVAGCAAERGGGAHRHPAPGRARCQSCRGAAETRAGHAPARHHAFGYRRRIPGRNRTPSKPSEQAGGAAERTPVWWSVPYPTRFVLGRLDDHHSSRIARPL